MLTIYYSKDLNDALDGNSARYNENSCEPNAEYCTVDHACEKRNVLFLPTLVDMTTGDEFSAHCARGEHD